MLEEKIKYGIIVGFICMLSIVMVGCGEDDNVVKSKPAALSIEETMESSCETSMIVQEHEIKDSVADDWGLGAINELFEMWGWYPSSNPTDIEEIAEGAGQEVYYIAAQKEKIEQILLNIPQIQDNNTIISFRTNNSKQHFGDIEWERYSFEQCELIMLDGQESGILGRAYLQNSNETWKDSNTAIFLFFFYLFETQELEVLEIVETTSGIIDYKTVLEYGDDGTTQIHTEEGLRLLDIQVELNPVKEFVPIEGLEGEGLDLYVESIFLDTYRCPNSLQKYKKVFDKETYAMLESANYYYDNPKEIYDFANTSLYTETRGTVHLGSQFQTSLLEMVVIELHVHFEYDKTTGSIVVIGADLCLIENSHHPLSEMEEIQTETRKMQRTVYISSDVPKPYIEVLKQYQDYLNADVQDTNDEAVLSKMEGGKWCYLSREFCGHIFSEFERAEDANYQLEYGAFYYSLVDLTGDGVSELVLGSRNNEDIYEGIMPEVIYYCGNNSEIKMEGASSYFTMTLHENGIIKYVSGGVDYTTTYLQFQKNIGEFVVKDIADVTEPLQLAWVPLLEQTKEGEEKAGLHQFFNNDLVGVGFLGCNKEQVLTDSFEYSEEVKGKFSPVIIENSIFPKELVVMLEEAFYDSCHRETRGGDSPYYKMLEQLGADEYHLTVEEMYLHFPQLDTYKNQIEWDYEMYDLIHEKMNGPLNCLEVFVIPSEDNRDTYIFLYKSGGSNGVVSVEKAELIDGQFVYVYDFPIQNDGNGRVIQYEGEYYYVFLQYNYQLKQYDGIRIHRLGDNPESENMHIRYLPKGYEWKCIYDASGDVTQEMDKYLESMKEDITSSEYLESGHSDTIFGDTCREYYGNGEKFCDFELPDSYDKLYEADITNTGIPIYMTKSAFQSSSVGSWWSLRMTFYLYDTLTDSMLELDKMSINNMTSEYNLVQMWFEEIGGKVYTFRIYHLSDYNYVLSVILVEGDQVTPIRMELISPKREFVLTEGEVFHTKG